MPTAILTDGSHTSARIPGPAGTFGFDSIAELRKNPLDFVVRTAREHGDVVRLKLGFDELLLLSHPAYIEHVLHANHRNYEKSRFYDRLRPLFGTGLIMSEGDVWRRQRSAAQPAFSGERLKSVAQASVQATDTMLDQWHIAAKHGKPIDVAAEMMRLALTIVLRTLFSAEPTAEEAAALNVATTVVLRAGESRLWSLTPFSPLPLSKEWQRFRGALATLHRYIDRLVDARRRDPGEHDDLLQLLIDARDPSTGEAFPDLQIRDQIMSMLLAGHETTASGLAWSWYFLSSRPDVVRRLRHEIDDVLNGRNPGFEDLSRLTYAQMIFEEATRLYPPVWTISRRAIADDEIGGYRVRAGTSVMLCPYIVHRDPRYWARPEVFDPQHFAPEEVSRRPRFTYFPFGGGPRACIGSRFAMIEAKVVLAMVARRFDLQLVPGSAVSPMPMISLRPGGEIMMNVTSRVP